MWRVVQMDGGYGLAAALADGAGSADFSDRGAASAVSAALTTLEVALQSGCPGDEDEWRALLQSAQAAAQEAVEQLAQAEENPLRSYACTLTCLVAANGQMAVLSLGDGIVIALDETGDLEAVSRLQRGEYANETFFLTQEDALEQAQFAFRAYTPAAVAMLSDGLARLALNFPEQTPFAPFFTPLIDFTGRADDVDQATNQLADFLDSERVNARTDDDKSLLLAVGS